MFGSLQRFGQRGADIKKPYYYRYREPVVRACLERCLSAVERGSDGIDWELVDYYEARVDIAVMERMGFYNIIPLNFSL